MRAVADPYGWGQFLSRSETGGHPGLHAWRLGSDDRHHLMRTRTLASKWRHFDAECACGFVLDGGPGLTLPSVQRRFALEHLHLAPTDAAVTNLTGRAGGRRR